MVLILANDWNCEITVEISIKPLTLTSRATGDIVKSMTGHCANAQEITPITNKTITPEEKLIRANLQQVMNGLHQ